MKFHPTLVAATVSATLLAACSSEDTGEEITDPSIDPSIEERSLRSFETSEAFYDALGRAIVSQSAGQYTYYELGVDEVASTQESNVAAPEGAPVADSNDSSADSGLSGGVESSDNDVTSTNVQEQGVDEQDWIKTSSDGSKLYVIESKYDDIYFGEPEPLSDDPIDDSPAYYEVRTQLRIMALDADTPDASVLQELDIDMEGRYAEGAYLYEKEASTSLFVTASGGSGWLYWGDSYAFGGQDSLITEVDVTDPSAATVGGNVRIDGQIVSSRRIGNHMFFASRYYPTIPDVQPWNLTTDQLQAAIDNTDLSTVLPQYTSSTTGESRPLIDPGECFVASEPSADSYYSPDIITLGVIDLDTLELTDSKCYLGASETLYASPNAVFLATTQWDYSSQPIDESGDVIDVDRGSFPASESWSDPRVDTDIHQFDIEAGQLMYAGTGSVKGHLGWNWLRKPFRMSEKDGYLRVATFNDQQGVDESPILLTVLQADGTGKLNTVASLPNETEPGFIGKPGEQLYASRFLGDRAYLVTFRQTDPLYVLDLSIPEAPRVVGELEIDGYSDYLHPIGEDYLLGIGKDAVAAPDGWGDGRGALVQGVKLSLFNVSNPADPTEVQSIVVGQRGTHSQALDDHRAITVQAATDDHPTRVSIGIDVFGETSPAVPTSSDTAGNYYDWSYSGLHGFDINVGADAGIVARGALVAAAPADSSEYFSWYGERDRSVMVNDSVFYIRGSAVYAAPWDDLANPSPAR